MWIITNRIQIPEGELHFSYARSSGPGGQNVNKVNSKAVLHWSPANLPERVRERFVQAHRLTTEGDIVIMSDRFRDRLRNQEDCLEKLKAMILAAAIEPKIRKKTKPSRSSLRRNENNKRLHGEKKKNRSRNFD